MTDITRLLAAVWPTRRLLCLLLLTAVSPTASAFGDDGNDGGGYQLGQGYNWGSYNFAGYSDVVEYLPTQNEKNQALSTASIFISGHISSYFNPFVEASFSNKGITAFNTAISSPGQDASLTTHRIYNDIEMTDTITLRLGNMLSPVGAWNQIPAPALVLTTARPAVTDLNFGNYLAGISVNYTDRDGDLPDMQVYWQPVSDLNEQPSGGVLDAYQLNHYKMVAGFHASLPLPLLDQIGVSFQRSRNGLDTDQSLYGIDFKYSFQSLTLQGEFTYSELSGALQNVLRHHESGAYVAASYALGEQWAVTSWVEEYSGRNASTAARDLLWGIVYHPLPAMALKLEYLKNFGGEPVNPTGLLMSWSVLF